MQVPDVILVAVMVISAPLMLAAIVAFLVHRQNHRVLAKQADKGLKAMLQAGDFLNSLARDPSLPEDRRRRAQELAHDYPSSDQLQVFAESLLAHLRRAARQPSQ